MAAQPSVAVGARLALRLSKLVAASWLFALLAFVPACAVLAGALLPVGRMLPDGPLPAGDGVLLLHGSLTPVIWPLGLALLSGCLAVAAWTVLWHAGTARWWLGAGAARVRLAEIVGHGVVWWWRYLRLALAAALTAALLAAAVWVPVALSLVAHGGSGAEAHPRLLVGLALAVTAALLGTCWAAHLRSAWALAESGRRSAVAAWLRGFWTTLRRPLSSWRPLLSWAVPGVAAPVLPLLLDPVLAAPLLLLGLLVSTFCWVALYLSFAPQEPPEAWMRTMRERAAARAAKPRDPSDRYKTGRIPTQPPDR